MSGKREVRCVTNGRSSTWDSGGTKKGTSPLTFLHWDVFSLRNKLSLPFSKLSSLSVRNTVHVYSWLCHVGTVVFTYVLTESDLISSKPPVLASHCVLVLHCTTPGFTAAKSFPFSVTLRSTSISSFQLRKFL